MYMKFEIIFLLFSVQNFNILAYMWGGGFCMYVYIQFDYQHRVVLILSLQPFGASQQLAYLP